jgi:NTE family protein
VRNVATIAAAIARESVQRRPAPRAVGRVVSLAGPGLPGLLGHALLASIRWHAEPDEAASWSVVDAAYTADGEVVATVSRADEVRAGAVRAQPGDGRAPTVTVVPPATAGDEARVGSGLLDISTPYGQAVGRLARAVLGLRVGVALGAGSTRGYAHFGVLEVLGRHGVPLDAVAGTSIGAAVAYLAAIDHPLDQAMDAIDEVARRTIRPRLPGASLLSSAGLRRGLHAFCGERLIEECAHPLAIVAADIERKAEVVFDAGLVWPALLASMTIPGLYPAQRVGGVLAIDGGVVNPIPVTAAAALGADIVIAVRLGRRAASEPHRATATAPSPGRASAARTILRAVELLETTLTVHRSRAASVVIEAATEPIEGAGLRRFADGRRYVAGGSAAAEDALPRLRALLPWLRRT